MWVGKGDVILSSLPYASILYPEYQGILCSWCYANQANTDFQCEFCEQETYCSARCLEDSREQHLLECGLPSPSCPTTGTLLLRVWLRWSSEWGGDRVEEGVPGTQKARRFAHFLTHEKDLRASPKIMEDIKKYHTDIKRVLGDEAPKFDQFLQLYGKVIINDFELSQRENRKSIGMGVYLAPSILDHSCQPNAWVEFEGNKLVLRSKCDQEKPDMSKVFISYLDSRQPKAVRQQYLQRHYFFQCGCDRCNNEI